MFVFGYVVGMAITLLLIMFGYMWHDSKKQPSDYISKDEIITDMTNRMGMLSVYIHRDFGANVTGYNEAYREVKYWKEAIERGCFDKDDSSG